MKISDRIRTELVNKATTDFNEALDGFTDLWLTYPTETELLVEYWDEFTFDMGFMAELRTPYPQYLYGQLLSTFSDWEIISAISFLQFFINHEIHDDGEPHIVYMAKERPSDYLYLSTVERRTWLDSPWYSVPFADPKGCPILLRRENEAYSPNSLYVTVDRLRDALIQIRVRNRKRRNYPTSTPLAVNLASLLTEIQDEQKEFNRMMPPKVLNVMMVAHDGNTFHITVDGKGYTLDRRNIWDSSIDLKALPPLLPEGGLQGVMEVDGYWAHKNGLFNGS